MKQKSVGTEGPALFCGEKYRNQKEIIKEILNLFFGALFKNKRKIEIIGENKR